jgi:hypothetical protein
VRLLSSGKLLTEKENVHQPRFEPVHCDVRIGCMPDCEPQVAKNLPADFENGRLCIRHEKIGWIERFERRD